MKINVLNVMDLKTFTIPTAGKSCVQQQCTMDRIGMLL